MRLTSWTLRSHRASDAWSVQVRCHRTERPKRWRTSLTSIFTVTPISIS